MRVCCRKSRILAHLWAPLALNDRLAQPPKRRRRQARRPSADVLRALALPQRDGRGPPSSDRARTSFPSNQPPDVKLLGRNRRAPPTLLLAF
jgi:hypothetical protein